MPCSCRGSQMDVHAPRSLQQRIAAPWDACMHRPGTSFGRITKLPLCFGSLGQPFSVQKNSVLTRPARSPCWVLMTERGDMPAQATRSHRDTQARSRGRALVIRVGRADARVGRRTRVGQAATVAGRPCGNEGWPRATVRASHDGGASPGGGTGTPPPKIFGEISDRFLDKIFGQGFGPTNPF